jgi:S-DNA-T family DNA segregation ATPase FtsK/SpoIIIE
MYGLPVVGILSGVSLIIGAPRWRRIGGGGIIILLTACILIEQLIFRSPRPWTWPVPDNGGGIIGWLIYAAAFPLIGNLGTALCGLGALVVGLGAAFNLSYVGLLKRFIRFFRPILPPVPEIAPAKALDQRRSIWKTRLKSVQSDPVPFPVPELAPTERPDVVTSVEIEEEAIPFIPVTPTPRYTAPRLSIEADSADYEFPPLGLLDPGGTSLINSKENVTRRQEQSKILEETLASFQVEAKVVHVTSGPAVTRFELEPGVGVKIAKITALAKDIALKLASPDVRIEAPIPGKALVGIEVPNVQTDTVTLRALLEKTDFFNAPSKLMAGIGLTITGEPILMDLAKMPHVLIAGATGAGKSVCVNGLILSILLRSRPDEVKFLMIDPKKVELSLYDGIPHLVAPVVTDPHKAAATLNKWALVEMERRYETFSKVGVKNIEGFNLWVKEKESVKPAEDGEGQIHEVHQKLPYIVVIIDELADLMMVASQEVENTICRLAQMSRATGIHLVIATQRPSVDVITGLIKANVPSRISFFLQSQIDSRTILDMPGAEKLLGKGDMLYSPVGSFKPQRVQGVYVSEKEVKGIVHFLKAQGAPTYVEAILEVEPSVGEESRSDPDQDELFDEAKQIIMSTQYASTSYLQRKLRIGYNRAARLMEELEKQGIVAQYAGERRPRTQSMD